MGEKQKVTIAGNMVKKLRESKGLSRESIIESAKESGDVKLSLSTLRRIENDDRDMSWDIELGNFLAGQLDVPSSYILPEEGTPSKHSIQLSRIETGERFKGILDDCQGFSLQLDGEPDEKKIRELYLELYRLLREDYGGGKDYYKLRSRKNENRDETIEETKRKFELRDFIDDLGASGYSIFAKHFYRYEAFMDPDGDGVTWMGILNKADLERLAKPWDHYPEWEYMQGDPSYYPVEPDGTSWRVILKIVIQKSEDAILHWEVDADPGQLSTLNSWQSNTLRDFMVKGGVLQMDHEDFLTKVSEEVNEFRGHTMKSEKKGKMEATN